MHILRDCLFCSEWKSIAQKSPLRKCFFLFLPVTDSGGRSCNFYTCVDMGVWSGHQWSRYNIILLSLFDGFASWIRDLIFISVLADVLSSSEFPRILRCTQSSYFRCKISFYRNRQRWCLTAWYLFA